MKKRKSKRFTVAIIANILFILFSFNSNTVYAANYNAASANSYSYAHWNDGVGLCAQFVSNCLSAGGCSAWSTSTSDLLSQLQSGGWGTLYELSGSSEIYAYSNGNNGKVSVGDPIFFKCNTCGSWPHTAIVSKIDGNGIVYCNQHNPAQKDMHYLKTYYNSSHSGHSFSVYSFHMISHTHSYSNTVVKPTCIAQGYTMHKCSCGNSYNDSYTAALGHSYSAYTVDKQATCVDKGSKSCQCTRCGSKMSAEIPATGHEYSSGEWTYCDELPSGVTSDNYTIEYANIYTKNAVVSPGSGWTKGEVVSSKYVNSGGTYENMGIPLAESNTRVLVGYYYYHFCGANTGNYANYTSDSRYVHYDALSSNGVSVASTGIDVDDPRYTFYNLVWSSNGSPAYCATGTTCDGSAGGHGNRSSSWYKTYVYQNRVLENTYKWTKVGEYGSTKDSKAVSVKYRYRKNNVNVTKANFSQDGEVYTKCKNCEYRKNSSVIPKVSEVKLSSNVYTYSGAIQKPTVLVKDRTGKTLVNGSDYSVTYSDASSKIIGNYSVTVNLKGNYIGSKTLYYKIDNTNSHKHSLSYIKKKNASCKSDGNIAYYYCSACNKYFLDANATKQISESSKVIKATGHKWDGGTVTKAATCVATGVRTYKCSKCSATKTATISKIPVPKKNTVIKDSRGNSYKVLDASKKTVEYKAIGSKKTTKVTIPDTVKYKGLTYKVTKIAEQAFKGNTKLKEVTIGKNVTTIGASAFKNCKALTSISLPSKCYKIGSYAFDGSSKLKTIKVASTKLTKSSLASNALKGISGKTTIKVPKSKEKTYKSLFKLKGFKGNVKIIA